MTAHCSGCVFTVCVCFTAVCVFTVCVCALWMGQMQSTNSENGLPYLVVCHVTFTYSCEYIQIIYFLSVNIYTLSLYMKTDPGPIGLQSLWLSLAAVSHCVRLWRIDGGGSAGVPALKVNPAALLC